MDCLNKLKTNDAVCIIFELFFRKADMDFFPENFYIKLKYS